MSFVLKHLKEKLKKKILKLYVTCKVSTNRTFKQLHSNTKILEKTFLHIYKLTNKFYFIHKFFVIKHTITTKLHYKWGFYLGKNNMKNNYHSDNFRKTPQKSNFVWIDVKWWGIQNMSDDI